MIAQLIDRLISEIQKDPTDFHNDAHFLRWAAEIAQAQYESNPTLHEKPPVTVQTLEQLPPLTTDVFKYGNVKDCPASRIAAAVFKTSGTTQKRRGQHTLYRTDIYETSALMGFEQFLLDHLEIHNSWKTQSPHLLALVPEFSTANDSSLSFMLDLFSKELFESETTFGLGTDGLRLDQIAETVARVAEDDRPLFLFATTLACRALLESDVRFSFPNGSLVLTTGGSKGLETEVKTSQIERALQERFGSVVLGSEFGMTELLSQGYRVGNEPFRLAPWCRVLTLDPTSKRRLPHRQPGLLRFVDLANVQSAMTIQTADLGTTVSECEFYLHGRATGAELRGCSLSFEELTR